jgi:hypothetical protein
MVTAGGAGTFTARLESGDVVVTGTRQPLVDGARALIGLGFDPALMLTMRHEGKSYDSFRPLPIATWAKWTYTEPDKARLKQQRWMPRDAAREGQKLGADEVPATRVASDLEALHDSTGRS